LVGLFDAVCLRTMLKAPSEHACDDGYKR
jgi:hypothetical protein